MESGNRDLRMDFFRGLGLLCIYSNHIGDISDRNIFTYFSWRPWGVSDAAELFIFISGYLFGLVYYKTFMSKGFWACQWKAAQRALQIYIANVVTLLLMLGMIKLFHVSHSLHLLKAMGLAPFFDHPSRAIENFILLDNVPGVFDVLFLYVFFLMIMPSLLYLFHRNRLAAILLSLALYLVSFMDPIDKMFNHCKIWSFDLDPLAWQLLFFVGMTLGIRKRANSLELKARPGLVKLAAGVLLLIMALKLGTGLIRHDVLHLGRLAQWAPYLLPMTGKINLEPLRLIHFFCLAYLFWAFFSRDNLLLHTRLGRMLIHCGQNSLKIFCLGLLLSYLACLLFELMQLSLPLQCGLIACGWGIMLLGGYGLTLHKQHQQQRPALATQALVLPQAQPLAPLSVLEAH